MQEEKKIAGPLFTCGESFKSNRKTVYSRGIFRKDLKNTIKAGTSYSHIIIDECTNTMAIHLSAKSVTPDYILDLRTDDLLCLK